MKKTVIIMLATILAILVIAACGAQPTGAPEYTLAPTTAAAADTEWLHTTTAEDSSTEITEPETSANSAAPSTSSSAAPKPTEKAVNSTASPSRPTPASAAAAIAPVVPTPVTAAQTTTTTRYVPPQTAATTTTTRYVPPPTTTAAPPPIPKNDYEAMSQAQYQEEAIRALNAMRAERGLAPMAKSDYLMSTCLDQARKMAAAESSFHTGEFPPGFESVSYVPYDFPAKVLGEMLTLHVGNFLAPESTLVGIAVVRNGNRLYACMQGN